MERQPKKWGKGIWSPAAQAPCMGGGREVQEEPELTAFLASAFSSRKWRPLSFLPPSFPSSHHIQEGETVPCL